MPDRKRYLATLAILLIVDQALSAPPVARPRVTPLKETFHREAPVSGRVITGVLVSDGLDSTHHLALLPPETLAGKSVCVQVVSRDGRYWAENTFELPPAIGGQPVLLEYPSTYQALLQTLGEDELALLSYPGDCGRGSTRQALISARSFPEKTSRRILQIFVNSGRTDTYLMVKGLPNARPARCRLIRQGRRTAFDTVCRLELPASTIERGSIRVRILRRRYERMLPATELIIALPSQADG